jgi:hypothetical protein
MSREKGRVLDDQRNKLRIIARHLGWSKLSNWEDGLGVSAASVHNWSKEKPINRENLERIAKAASLELADLDLPFAGLCSKLGIDTAELSSDNPDPLPVFDRRKLGEHDVDIMQRVAGKHVILYLSREGNPQEEYITVQPVNIGHYNKQRLACPLVLPINVETKKPANGWIRSTSERLVGIITYHDEYYPESIFYGMPFFDGATPILYGIYTDVTSVPDKEIFAVRFVMFPVTNSINSKLRLERDHAVFPAAREILGETNLDPDRKRFVITGDRQTGERIKGLVRIITAMG